MARDSPNRNLVELVVVRHRARGARLRPVFLHICRGVYLWYARIAAAAKLRLFEPFAGDEVRPGRDGDSQLYRCQCNGG